MENKFMETLVAISELLDVYNEAGFRVTSATTAFVQNPSDCRSFQAELFKTLKSLGWEKNKNIFGSRIGSTIWFRYLFEQEVQGEGCKICFEIKEWDNDKSLEY